MATQWLRRAWLAAAGASVLLAACGGGEVDSALHPSRIVVFGDAMADIGQNAGNTRYTVNDGSINNWTLEVVRQFNVGLAPAKNGGNSYATGNARVTQTPGAGNDAAAGTVRGQIDTFLGARRFTDTDLVIVSAGTSDVIAEAKKVMDGTQTGPEMVTALGQAGTQLGAQVRRLVNAGARHVVVAGPYNLERSPWAKQTGEQALLKSASAEFNNKFLLAVADLGETVLYVDAAQQFNLYEGNRAGYALSNVVDPVCNSRDAGEGIGTGTGEVDSSECDTGDLVAPAYNEYLFADRVYPTPRGHRLFGEYAYGRIRNRW